MIEYLDVSQKGKIKIMSEIDMNEFVFKYSSLVI